MVKEKLRSLLSWIKEQNPQAEGKICVDIQPTMDKVWAVRAGLGWLGKHSNVITPEYGSWVFIGELLLNLELELDTEPMDDHCGTLHTLYRCLPDAGDHRTVRGRLKQVHLLRNYRAARAGIAEPIQNKLSGWLYGCDICQDVCPWNRFEGTTNETRFEPREGNVNASAESVNSLRRPTRLVFAEVR